MASAIVFKSANIYASAFEFQIRKHDLEVNFIHHQLSLIHLKQTGSGVFTFLIIRSTAMAYNKHNRSGWAKSCSRPFVLIGLRRLLFHYYAANRLLNS